MTISTVFPHKELLVDSIPSTIEPDAVLYRTARSLHPVTARPEAARAKMSEVFSEIALMHSVMEVGLINHVELIKHKSGYGGGALLFDDRDDLVVHVLHATIGDFDESPKLTAEILQALRVPPNIIRDLHFSVWGDPEYRIVLWRSSSKTGWPEGWQCHRDF